MKNNTKQSYIAPALTVVQFAVEQGFALTLRVNVLNLEIDNPNLISNYNVVNDGSRDYSNPINTSVDPNWQPSNNFWNF